MTAETSKQLMRRITDHRYATRWFRGDGVDIGCGTDPLNRYVAYFPLITSVKPWDLPDGDAMLMAGVADGSYDFVHSSHCLEHLVDPVVSLRNWIRICRPGGYLIITVPDEDLYEQGVWPSTFNADHKWTFTLGKKTSWSPRSVSLLALLGSFLDDIEIIKVELLDSGFDRSLPRQDQTRGMLAESAIEFVLRRRLAGEGAVGAAAVDVQTLLAQAQAAQQQGQATQAEGLYRQILRASPKHALALFHLGEVLRAQGRNDEARQMLEAALPEADNPADVYCELGWIGMDSGHTEDAVRMFGKAVELNPGHVQAHIQLGFACLKSGDFVRGAQGLDWIYRDRGFGNQLHLFADEAGQPISLAGRTVAVSADAGLGDTLQFVRYARMLKEQGATVIVEAQPALVRLLEATPYIDRVYAQGQLRGPFDLRVPLHNLIGAFGTTLATVPGGVPYLVAPQDEAARYSERLAVYQGLKVGLAWAGNPGLRTDARRSIPPALLAPLGGVTGVQLVSLQKDGGTPNLALLDWTAELADMADTAALIASLDLVIAADTAVVHLAGALGVPVWLLNRYDGCWRWLEERADSPWYPTLRQFRQRTPGDWQGVVADVAQALRERVAAGGD